MEAVRWAKNNNILSLVGVDMHLWVAKIKDELKVRNRRLQSTWQLALVERELEKNVILPKL